MTHNCRDCAVGIEQYEPLGRYVREWYKVFRMRVEKPTLPGQRVNLRRDE